MQLASFKPDLLRIAASAPNQSFIYLWNFRVGKEIVQKAEMNCFGNLYPHHKQVQAAERQKELKALHAKT